MVASASAIGFVPFEASTADSAAVAGRPPFADGGAVDLPRLAHAVREMLVALGEDPDRPGLADTPRRAARAYAELFRGLRESPATHLARTFDCEHDDIVLARDIAFAGLSERDLLPLTGRAHIAYLPGDGGVVGLSKLARTVEVFARRPQVQQRLTDQITGAIEQHLMPRALAVVVEADHLCLTACGGAGESSARMVTSAVRGAFRDDAAQGTEVLNLILNSRRYVPA